MKNPKYFDLKINKYAWIVLITGSGPLLLLMLLVKVGLWPDPNPNPIGLGIMAMLTLWPSLACIIAGFILWLWKNYRAKTST